MSIAVVIGASGRLGSAPVAKHFPPPMPRKGSSVIAANSTRVGRIEHNRLGARHACRASTAEIELLLKCFAIELKRRAPEAVDIGLHPGTVDTPLSKPFKANVAAQRLFSPSASAAHLPRIIDRVGAADSGRVFGWGGSRAPW